jgi:hypothetical protein
MLRLYPPHLDLVQPKITCFVIDRWFDKLTTNGIKVATNGLSPFALSLSKGTLIAKQVS